MNIAILLSAGCGTRMKNKLPKQFIEIDHKPLFIYTIEKFLIKEIDKIILVINPDYKDMYIDYLQKYSIKNVDLVIGGNSRQESVYNAINYLEDKCNNSDIVLIHDCARPLVNRNIIVDNIEKCQNLKTSIATVINIVDTIIDKEYNLVDRDNLLRVQTPQTFLYSDIKFAHQKALESNELSASDDIQLVKKVGLKINYVLGSKLNFKVTEPEDITLFCCLRNVGDS